MLVCNFEFMCVTFSCMCGNMQAAHDVLLNETQYGAFVSRLIFFSLFSFTFWYLWCCGHHHKKHRKFNSILELCVDVQTRQCWFFIFASFHCMVFVSFFLVSYIYTFHSQIHYTPLIICNKKRNIHIHRSDGMLAWMHSNSILFLIRQWIKHYYYGFKTIFTGRIHGELEPCRMGFFFSFSLSLNFFSFQTKYPSTCNVHFVCTGLYILTVISCFWQ